MTDLSEKILKNIKVAFAKDPLIDEYDFLPVRAPLQNTNPVITEGHKLGIEAWAINNVFPHCHQCLMSWKINNSQRKIKHKEHEDLAQWSQIIVMVTADFMTAWNVRKRLLVDGWLHEDDELIFTELILTKHPKSTETFFHRKWLLSRIYTKDLHNATAASTSLLPNDDTPCGTSTKASQFSSSSTKTSCEQVKTGSPLIDGQVASTDSVSNSSPHCATSEPQQLSCDGSICQNPSKLQELFEHEIQLCQCAAERYANNYHAWTHRIWVLKMCFGMKVGRQELDLTKQFALRHVSDHSCYHYRQQVLDKMSMAQTPLLQHQLLLTEIDLTTDLITTYPGHEAVWYHRRALLLQMINLCRLSSTMQLPTHQSMQLPTHQSVPKRLKPLDSDYVSVNNLRTDEEKFCKLVTEQCQCSHDPEKLWQVTLADKHRRFVERSLPSKEV